ncbi:MAG TPA: dephospho-CoA kinase [Chlamydiae bacterium]|nr:Dephospho-CoA kinase [Candidatus Anoxychlamydiales bacterium]HEU64408.1 dephospho-CoA kinase [Chlamydiota bacterium]
MLKKIVITGNIAAGKSEALKIFKKLKAYTVDADTIAHDLIENDFDIKKQVLDLFGEKILEKGKINRKKIAKIVFSDENKLKKLEKIIHPKILNEIEKEYERVKNKNFNFFVVEIPLLFEIGYQGFFDIVVTITTKDIIAKKRYKDKDYTLRKQRQLSETDTAKLSDFVIENNQSLSDLEKNIKKLLVTFKNF